MAITTKEDEDAVFEVLRMGTMSSTDVTQLFENEFAHWQGIKYCLGLNIGTSAIQAALFGCKVAIDEKQSMSYIYTSLYYATSGARVYIDFTFNNKSCSSHIKKLII